MNTRLANHKDIDVLIKLRFDYYTSENWEITKEKSDLFHSQLLKYYSKHLNIDFFAALVENDNGNIVSCAFLAISEMPANLSVPTGKKGAILNVLTYPECRKRGYATKAMNLLIEEAQRQDLSFIELMASELGMPLYRKLGFQEPKYSSFTRMKMELL